MAIAALAHNSTTNEQTSLLARAEMKDHFRAGFGSFVVHRNVDTALIREETAEMANKKSIIPESEEEKLNVVYRLTVRIAEELEQARIAEYTQLLHRPFRLIMLNLLSGAARGVGVAIGFTFFAATIIYVLQGLGALNLPIIGDYIADIVRIVQRQLELKTY